MSSANQDVTAAKSVDSGSAMLAPPDGGASRGWRDRVLAPPGLARSSGIRYPLLGGVGVGLVTLVVVVLLGGKYNDAILVLALSYGFVTMGMAVQLGHANQLVLSQSVFMAVGAYGVGILNTKYHMNVPVAMVVATVIGMALSVVLGVVIVRATGLAIALATLFLSVILSSIVVYSNYFGSSQGLGGIGTIIGGNSPTSAVLDSGIVVAVLLGLCVFLCARVVRSGVGLELALMGSDLRMAAAVGVRNRRRKTELFIFGSTLATIGGCVFGGTQQFVSPVSFDQSAELALLVMLFLGGRRSIYGAIIGTVALEFLSAESNYVSSHLLTIEGILFTVVLLLTPDGLLGLGVKGVRLVTALISRTRGIPAPSAGAESVVPTESSAPDVPRPDVLTTRSAAPADPVEGSKSGVDSVWALEVEDLTKRFGGVTAVDHVSLRIPESGIHALVGPNGAGKSTLFELVAGGIRPDSGKVTLFGDDMTGSQAADRAKAGVARTFQTVRLVPTLSALDNVAVAALPSHDTSMGRAFVRSQLLDAREKAYAMLSEFGVAELAQRKPGQLTLEGQRMVEFARALVAQPRMLVLDEPASGLSVEQRDRLSDTLLRLGERLTVVLVEHDLIMVERISQQVIVLIDGRVVYDGDAAAFRKHPEVRTRLLGLVDPLELAHVQSAHP